MDRDGRAMRVRRAKIPPFKWNLELPYLTGPEKTEFQRLLTSGALTIFKLATCAECGSQVPKIENDTGLVKRYCDKKCWEKNRGNE